MPTRRQVLGTFLAGLAAPRIGWAAAGSPAYLGAAKEDDGQFALFGLDEAGADIFRIPLPDRGHAAACHPTVPEAVAFARRPGRFAIVLDCVTGQVTHQMDAPDGHHFYGHGVFIDGGDILATTENHIDSGQGRIGLWSRSQGYKRIGEFASHGIGPHDIRRLDGDVLVVANGGILTHPDHGRDKLNLDTMRPNLAYLSSTGEVLDMIELDPELHHASIRHLAVRGDGLVAFAMQWEGDALDVVPLLGLHRRGDAPVLAEADYAEQRAMNGYAGSISFDGIDGRTVAITSPRGGRVHRFDDRGTFLSSFARADVCGLAPALNGFVISDGLGGFSGLCDGRVRPLHLSDGRAWDNHLIKVEAV